VYALSAMCADHNQDDFEDAARSIAREVSEFFERTVEQFDSDQIADAIGVDPDQARQWVQSAGSWLRVRVEGLGADLGSRSADRSDDPRGPSSPPQSSADPRGPSSPRPSPADDPLRGAGPHPLDIPTDEQGLALAALDSGRWTVEPSSKKLMAHGEGPAPSDALGLVRELRVHDWIDADGEVTLAGRNALSRWLDSATR
jgi:hypothetical protein